MAWFDRFTPVLRFTRGKDPDARWVLWPALAWRVVAPVPREQPINLFQRAALALARAGVVRVVDVAERLLIAPDLAGLVAQELRSRQLLDHHGLPTHRGLQVLDDLEHEPPDELRVGHVLSDPFTGKLWPRFLTGDLPLAAVEPDEEGWPVLLSGSPGDPWKDRTRCILPADRDVRAAPPTARDVLHAVRRHRRRRNQSDEPAAPHLHRVSFVDERPQPYLLALRVYRHPSGDWTVDEPFGPGEALELRSRLEERLDLDAGLRTWLKPLVGGDVTTPTLAQLQKEAEWNVEERLTLAIRQHEPVYERLVATWRARLEADLDGAPADKWDDIVIKAQRAAERTLRTIHDPWRAASPPLYSELAEADKLFNQQLLDAIAGELGLTTPLPPTLTAVRRGKVQHAEDSVRGSLRPLLVLALLAAGRDPEHPLRRAAPRHPDLLARLDALAQARDRAAHDSNDRPSAAVDRHLDTVLITVESLLLSR
jgi:hypothetical protein